jgi:hypothetical protein
MATKLNLKQAIKSKCEEIAPELEKVYWRSHFNKQKPNQLYVPMKADDIHAIKDSIRKNDGEKAAAQLSELRESLENFEKRISNRPRNYKKKNG